MVTLHITLDPVVPFQHEYIYQDMVTQAGGGNFLTVIPVSGDGHCNFSGEQINSAFGMLVQQASAQPRIGSQNPSSNRVAEYTPPPDCFCTFLNYSNNVLASSGGGAFVASPQTRRSFA